MPIFGRNSAIGIGAESTWGTAVARTAWFRTVSSGLKRTIERIARGTLCEADASNNIASQYTKSDDAGGPIEILMGYEGMGLWLHHLLWKTPTTTGPDGGGMYTHTFKLQTAPPTGGLTIEQLDGSAQAEVFEGCRLNKGTWKVAVGELMHLSLDVIAETSGGKVSAGTPAFTTNEIDVAHFNAGTLSFNSGTFTVLSCEWTIDHKLVRRQQLGSSVTAEPATNGFDEILLKVELEYDAVTFYTAFLADTASDAVVVFSGTGGRTLTFTLHSAFIKDVGIPVNAVGIMKQTVTLQAKRSSTANQGFVVQVVNTQTTALAA